MAGSAGGAPLVVLWPAAARQLLDGGEQAKTSSTAEDGGGGVDRGVGGSAQTPDWPVALLTRGDMAA